MLLKTDGKSGNLNHLVVSNSDFFSSV